MKVELHPYAEIDGIRTIKDSTLEALFERLQSEGLKRWVFPDGGVQIAEDFVAKFKYDLNYFFLVMVDGEVAGFVWLDTFRGVSAQAHFALFQNYQGETGIEIGKAVVPQLLDLSLDGKETIFETIIGVVPANNIRAAKFVEKFGLKQIGEVPSMLYDYYEQRAVPGIILYTTKE